MKKLFIRIFTIFSLCISTCSSQNVKTTLKEESQKIVLEHVDFSRIDKSFKKYEQLQSQATWIKRFKYLAIGAGCTGLGFLIFNNYSNTQPNPKNNQSHEDKLDDKELDIEIKKVELKKLRLLINRLEKENQEKTFFINRVKKGSLKALDFVIYTAIAASIWTIINKSGNALKNQFGGIDLDSSFYKQKNAKINDLIKQLGIFLVQHEQNSKDEHASKFFDLMFADILINHSTLVRWFEDFVGFIKCMVISDTGRDSIEVACLEKDILSLSANLNQFTDKISCILNSCTDAQEHSILVEQATTSYLAFCKQFSKFIYDCGLYLYEEDFLQEDSLQNNALQN